MTTPGFNQPFVNDRPDLVAIYNKAYADTMNRMVDPSLPTPTLLQPFAASTNQYPAAFVTPAAAPSPSPPPQQTQQQQRPSCCCCRGCSERLRIVLCCLSLLFDVLANLYLYFGGLMIPSSISGNGDDEDDTENNTNNSTNIDNSTSDPFAVGDTTSTSTNDGGGTSSISIVFLVTAAGSLFFLYVELQLAWRAFRENVADGPDNSYFALSAKYVSVLMLLITEGLDSLIAICVPVQRLRTKKVTS
jgi:hypothetical protein